MPPRSTNDNRQITIQPLHTRSNMILKIEPPKAVKECKQICSIVNYISLSFPELQRLLQPIYHLTKKGIPFIWLASCQMNFEQLKEQLCKPPVPYLPNKGGRFILYSDTSWTCSGSTLWQIQNAKPCLTGYASKSLPSSCKITVSSNLEMFGLYININS